MDDYDFGSTYDFGTGSYGYGEPTYDLTGFRDVGANEFLDYGNFGDNLGTDYLNLGGDLNNLRMGDYSGTYGVPTDFGQGYDLGLTTIGDETSGLNYAGNGSSGSGWLGSLGNVGSGIANLLGTKGVPELLLGGLGMYGNYKAGQDQNRMSEAEINLRKLLGTRAQDLKDNEFRLSSGVDDMASKALGMQLLINRGRMTTDQVNPWLNYMYSGRSQMFENDPKIGNLFKTTPYEGVSSGARATIPEIGDLYDSTQRYAEGGYVQMKQAWGARPILSSIPSIRTTAPTTNATNALAPAETAATTTVPAASASYSGAIDPYTGLPIEMVQNKAPVDLSVLNPDAVLRLPSTFGGGAQIGDAINYGSTGALQSTGTTSSAGGHFVNDADVSNDPLFGTSAEVRNSSFHDPASPFYNTPSDPYYVAPSGNVVAPAAPSYSAPAPAAAPAAPYVPAAPSRSSNASRDAFGGSLFNFARGGLAYFSGGSKGQADDIPARVSSGEYVMDADVVAALGDGNPAAGARELDRMRERIRAHKRSAPASKIPPKAKAPEKYLGKKG